MKRKKKVLSVRGLLGTIALLGALILFAGCATTTLKTAAEKGDLAKVKSINDSYYEKGILYIGFKKGVSQTRAEEILKNLNFKYKRTENINAGRKFFYKTGEKFLMRVPDGEELMWLEKLNKIPEVEAAGQHIDPRKTLID